MGRSTPAQACAGRDRAATPAGSRPGTRAAGKRLAKGRCLPMPLLKSRLSHWGPAHLQPAVHRKACPQAAGAGGSPPLTPPRRQPPQLARPQPLDQPCGRRVILDHTGCAGAGLAHPSSDRWLRAAAARRRRRARHTRRCCADLHPALLPAAHRGGPQAEQQRSQLARQVEPHGQHDAEGRDEQKVDL